MPCFNCEKNLPIANRKYNLCANCNSIRLTGKSTFQRNIDSAKKSQAKQKDKYTRSGINGSKLAKVYPIGYKSNIIVSNRINKQTGKDAGIKSKLSLLKKDIELEAIQNDSYFCKGCGESHAGLDKSHILSVGQFKQYELLKANIQLMCRKCHTIWESGTIEEQMSLLCFNGNLQFIAVIEPLEHQKFLTRMEGVLAFPT